MSPEIANIELHEVNVFKQTAGFLIWLMNIAKFKRQRHKGKLSSFRNLNPTMNNVDEQIYSKWNILTENNIFWLIVQ